MLRLKRRGYQTQCGESLEALARFKPRPLLNKPCAARSDHPQGTANLWKYQYLRGTERERVNFGRERTVSVTGQDDDSVRVEVEPDCRACNLTITRARAQPLFIS